MKRNLIEVKKELEQINEVIKERKQVYEDLVLLPGIERFQNNDKELKLATKKRYELLEEQLRIEQAECRHPLWYLLNSHTDGYEGRTYWNCKCIACGKVIEDRNREFENVIMGDGMFANYNRSHFSYDDIKKVYTSLLTTLDTTKTNEETSTNANDIGKLLVKKYNVKTKR